MSPIELPEWPSGTVTLLATAGTPPRVIPVSSALRAGPDRVLLGLAHRRESLRRLREDPRVSLTILAAGDVSISAEGVATVVADPLPGAENVVGVEIVVEQVREHGNQYFEVTDGIHWHWRDRESKGRDREVRSALAALASRG